MIADFRGLECFKQGQDRHEEIKRRFVESARKIMFGYKLVFDQFGTREEYITQVELYLYCDQWRDENTDRDSEQLKRETWYVTPDIGRIDITAGCMCENIYCGLLIRQIQGEREGPAIALRRIVCGEQKVNYWRWNSHEYGIVAQIRGQNVFNDGPLRLRQLPNSNLNRDIWIGPRVGVKKGEDCFRQAEFRVANRALSGLKKWNG
jgi:hypothetical protein